MGSGLEASKKRTPAIFLQLAEMCQGAWGDCYGNLPKKFAPEIEVPAQKNQICSLSLFIDEYDADVVQPARQY